MAKILGFLFTVMSFFHAQHAIAKLNINTTYGSDEGLANKNPLWSLGLQIGNFGSSAIVAQRVALFGGTWNLGIGGAYGSTALHVDYLAFLDEQFRFKTMNESKGYNHLRGEFLPYFGAGLLITRGVSLRVPIGMQYTMLRDPFNFYGGLALVTGRYLTDAKVVSQVWFNFGARILL